MVTKRTYKTFLYKWLLELREREPKLRGKRLKYNLSMQRALERDLNLL